MTETPPVLRAVGMERATLDFPVLLFTAAVCVVTAVLAGVHSRVAGRAGTIPAIRLREGGRSPVSFNRWMRFCADWHRGGP